MILFCCVLQASNKSRDDDDDDDDGGTNELIQLHKLNLCFICTQPQQ